MRLVRETHDDCVIRQLDFKLAHLKFGFMFFPLLTYKFERQRLKEEKRSGRKVNKERGERVFIPGGAKK